MRSLIAAVLSASVLFAPAVAGAAEELSVTDRLDQRRYVTTGDRAYVMGFQDGSFQAQGWHITGEMGGVHSQPLKLLDGLWFEVAGQSVGPATRFTSGWGHVRMDLPPVDGLELARVDVVPDGHRAALLGLRVHNPSAAARTVPVAVDARSEVMSQYPWSFTTPTAGDFDLPDTGAFADGALEFHDTGTPPVPNAEPHDWVAVVGSDRDPVAGETGDGHWGSQSPPVVCESEDQFTCDDGPFGKGTGGRLEYALDVPAGETRTLWIGVAGSDRDAAGARAELDAVLADPEAALAQKVATRERWAEWTTVSLPGDPRLARAVEWGKQNLLDSTQRATDLQIRDTDQGTAHPPPVGTVPAMRWFGAGWPDYPWLFGTDGEYTAFAAVAAGQFEVIADHARALRDVSEILNGDSGKVVHEVVADGSVYFGALQHPGNTDETAKFPSMVALIWRWTGDDAFRDDLYDFAVRNMRYVVEELDEDGDGWPEGLGNVERTGMGEEKLDNSVSLVRGLFDLGDMARAKGDTATATWALRRARDLRRRFEATWWMPAERQYADSLLEDEPVQQRHWIGQTPMEVELTIAERARPGLASLGHGVKALMEREEPCYSGERPYNRGLFHTGCGGGPEGEGERVIFSLNTAIQAVAEGNYGRLGAQRRYTSANAEPLFSEPFTGGTPDEQPGAMPEVLPSPDFDPEGDRDANILRCTRCRAMVLQAWGHYGTMWPVVHQQLGVRPDLGRGRLEVVPQVPPPGTPIAGSNIRLGDGALELVQASSYEDGWRTVVDTGDAPVERVRIGHTVPVGAKGLRVYLDGRRHGYRARLTNRGREVTVGVRPGRHVLEVTAR